jgi:cell wall assembly regulator SMI1
MKSLKSIMAAFLVLSITSCLAQSKNTKTETVSISGNCGMCKSTIEKAGNQKKEATAEWDKSTKMATLSYDSLKTSKSEILKRIALVGYDNEMFVAPDDSYNNLPGCCQYDRAKNEDKSDDKPKMEMSEDYSKHNHSQNAEATKETDKTTTEIAKTDDLKIVFDNYFEVKNALVKSDGSLTASKASELLKSIEKVNMKQLDMDVHMVWMKVAKDLKADATKMAISKDADSQRTNFMSLSSNMYSVLKVANYEAPVYYQFCPMANDGKGANWLSTESTVKNPYYGSAMLSCGKTVETIK